MVVHQFEDEGVVCVEAGFWRSQTGSGADESQAALWGSRAGRRTTAFGGRVLAGIDAMRRERAGGTRQQRTDSSKWQDRARRLIQRGRSLPRKAARGPPSPVGARRWPPSNRSRARDVRFLRDSVRRDVLRRRLSRMPRSVYIPPLRPLSFLRSQPSCSSHQQPHTTTRCKPSAKSTGSPPSTTTMKKTTWTPTPVPLFLDLASASHPASHPLPPPMTGRCARLPRLHPCTQ